MNKQTKKPPYHHIIIAFPGLVKSISFHKFNKSDYKWYLF